MAEKVEQESTFGTLAAPVDEARGNAAPVEGTGGKVAPVEGPQGGSQGQEENIHHQYRQDCEGAFEDSQEDGSQEGAGETLALMKKMKIMMIFCSLKQC